MLGYTELKNQQLEAMVVFISGKDVFLVLPTGLGKSIICAAPPMAYDALLGTSLFVVVSAIMKDQVFWYSLVGMGTSLRLCT